MPRSVLLNAKGMEVSTQIIRDRDWLDANQAEIDELFTSSDFENFYFSGPWVRCWLKRQEPTAKVIIVEARSRSNKLVGFWPFVERPGLLGTKGLWPFVYDEANYFHPVCMKSAAVPLLNALENLLGEFLFCWIPLFKDSFWHTCFAEKIAQSRFLHIHRTPRSSSFISKDKGASFDDYLFSRVGTKTRKSLRYDQKALAQKGDVRFETFRCFEEVRAAMPATCMVEVESWKSSQGAGLYTARGKRGFFFELLPELAKEGRVWLSILRVDEVPIAWQIELVGKHSVGLHHLAYDERWKKYSPGKQLLYHRLHELWDSGKVVDFLPGHLDYKEKLATSEEPVHEIHWFRKTLRGFLARRLILGNIKVRRKIRQKAKETKAKRTMMSILEDKKQA